MPYHWTETPPAAPGETAPVAILRLRPHRSLPRGGFVIFIGLTAAMFLMPLLAFLGQMALWMLLVYLAGALALTWVALERSYASGKVTETLTLWQDRVRLVHARPGKPELSWEANPYWVRVAVLPEGGPVPDYLTLQGNGRTVELGAFLGAEERVALAAELKNRLARL